jgi:hypothetical protein
MTCQHLFSIDELAKAAGNRAIPDGEYAVVNGSAMDPLRGTLTELHPE